MSPEPSLPLVGLGYGFGIVVTHLLHETRIVGRREAAVIVHDVCGRGCVEAVTGWLSPQGGAEPLPPQPEPASRPKHQRRIRS